MVSSCSSRFWKLDAEWWGLTNGLLPSLSSDDPSVKLLWPGYTVTSSGISLKCNTFPLLGYCTVVVHKIFSVYYQCIPWVSPSKIISVHNNDHTVTESGLIHSHWAGLFTLGVYSLTVWETLDNTICCCCWVFTGQFPMLSLMCFNIFFYGE